MLKVILHADNPIMPFCEPARELHIQNRPLWLHQRDLLAKYTTRELELKKNDRLQPVREETIVYRDNLYFDQYYIEEFMKQAMQKKRPVRAAFHSSDSAFREHAFPLSTSYTPAGSLYLADLWYYPNGPEAGVEPLVIDLQTREIGYYHVPTYMSGDTSGGDLVFHVPLRTLIAIDAWPHVFIADTVFSQFAHGARFERKGENLGFKLKVMGKAIYEGRQVLECSELVRVGKNCTIDPSVVIKGPTTIGDNVTINAGAVLDNCLIGSNVNIAQDAQLMLSVVGDGAFLPFRAALFMTTIMSGAMVAQNTCLQMCVVGKNTFIGAGSTWTDYNLIPIDIRARDGNGKLSIANRPVLGGCVGNNCRIGSGMIVYPARTIESDVVLAASKERRIIDRDIRFEDSDHHKMRPDAAEKHKILYHETNKEESW
jgi:carbonic anhydrase/acetyltransferase-like protein (isoleucine patch superfamily)